MMKKLLLQPKYQKVIILTFIVFMAVVLPLVQWLNLKVIGVTQSPDTMLFYSTTQFSKLMIDYQASGRTLYIILRWTFDLIYPLVYGLFFLVLFYKLSKIKPYVYLVYLAVIFDYLENIFASINVYRFPEVNAFLIYLMQAFSIIKWLMIVFIIAIQIMLYIRRYRFGRKTKELH